MRKVHTFAEWWFKDHRRCFIIGALIGAVPIAFLVWTLAQIV